MKKNTTDLTKEYINEHPYIKHCLKKGLLNYSALARHIAKELNIQKSSSKEAILIAARRTHDTLLKDSTKEKEIARLIAGSEVEMKTKTIVFIVEKTKGSIDHIQSKLQQSYVLEGSDNYTIITQEKYAPIIKKELSNRIIKTNKNMALINIKSPKEIETIPGVISYLTSLFAENGVNVYEFLSCWTDTIFIIDGKDLQKALTFLTVG